MRAITFAWVGLAYTAVVMMQHNLIDREYPASGPVRWQPGWRLWHLIILLVLVMSACRTDPDSGLEKQSDPVPNGPTARENTVTGAATSQPIEAGTGDLSGMVLRNAQEAASGPEFIDGDDRSQLMREITADWGTDWERHTIPYDELTPVIPRDAIRSLDNPTFESVDDASRWLTESDPVMVVELEGIARAYPLRILVAHEIVNDSFGDRPVVVTYCPLCNSALVFDAQFDGRVLEFGTSGWLRNSDLVMYDRATESLWQQLTGEGIVGEFAGERLAFLPSSLVSFSDFSTAFPDGEVLSRDTGFRFAYDLSAYSGYDNSGENPFLFSSEIDARLPAMERVTAISLGDVDIAYPLSQLFEAGVVNDKEAGQELVVFYAPGMTSAFYNPLMAGYTDVGATGVFKSNLNGELLTFSKDGEAFHDDQTGSTWNILGQAIDGPLVGERLEPLVHGDYFWFAWSAFKPDTLIYEK